MTEIKFNVLIAEDEENIGNFISTILKTNGYKPIIATTGNQAIQCAESYCPDVILLDLGLPDMDGIDVISEIRKWAVTPIIVISARNRESEKVKALDAGADDYITKPFGNQELLARIRTALRHRRQPMGAETKTPMYHACHTYASAERAGSVSGFVRMPSCMNGPFSCRIPGKGGRCC